MKRIKNDMRLTFSSGIWILSLESCLRLDKLCASVPLVLNSNDEV